MSFRSSIGAVILATLLTATPVLTDDGPTATAIPRTGASRKTTAILGLGPAVALLGTNSSGVGRYRVGNLAIDRITVAR